ncbi:MAG TPA: hypothetical protein ENF57_00720 [Candidatus Korarchaeota archaeon]|nr:hypothetical protein [Candidatus Korarchaeota archaeon]
MDLLRKVFFSWGTMLGLIPFLVLLVYGVVVVSASVSGAAANMLSGWLLQEVVTVIVSAVVLIGLALLIARRQLKGGEGE